MDRPDIGNRRLALAGLVLAGWAAFAAGVAADSRQWRGEWPRTDFSRKSVDLSEIISGGPPKDGIPAIDSPRFRDAGEVRGIAASEPVISLAIGKERRAYPLRILIWHEIVNDTVSGIPIAVTYCPLCNSAVVFERRVAGRVLDFGTTGKLRRSDLVMYDRQTESWWQQFTGTAIVGSMTGRELKMLPARVESFTSFRARGGGRVLVPSNAGARPYGTNPYTGYDTSARPFLYRGSLPKGIAPMAYVVRVGKEAWPLDLIRRKGRITVGTLELRWTAGQNSALDQRKIASGRDIGNLVVQRRTEQGLRDEIHDLTFAFVFHAFVPDGKLHLE